MGRTALSRLTLIAFVLTMAGRAAAFSLLDDPGGGDIAARLGAAARWSAEPDPFGRGTGLHDGIQVAIEPGFAANLGTARVPELYGVSEAEMAALVEETVRRAFAAWESPALRFELHFDGAAVEGPTQGLELDVFARPLMTTFFGFADTEILQAEARRLTNGEVLPGGVIVGADVFLNRTRLESGIELLAQLDFPLEALASALQILLTHEVGHALGLGHPNDRPFFDTDTDPYNEMSIDPADPFAGLMLSSIPLDTPGPQLPIMWGGLSQVNPEDLLGLAARLADPSLAPDDRGGRDVLYPALPEPPCPGDCNGDGAVSVDELVTGVAIALGRTPEDACPGLDRDGDGVRVEDLLRAVAAALRGCA